MRLWHGGDGGQHSILHGNWDHHMLDTVVHCGHRIPMEHGTIPLILLRHDITFYHFSEVMLSPYPIILDRPMF